MVKEGEEAGLNRAFVWCCCRPWITIFVNLFVSTRSYAALRAADLDWIVGPGYSLGRVHSGEKP